MWRHAALGLFAVLLAGTLCTPTVIAQSRGISVEVRASRAVDAPVLETVQLYANSYALVVGIDNYDRWTDLSNAGRDADKVAAALTRKGFSVQVLKDLNGSALETALEDFFYEKGADPEARLLVWFAGHGYSEAGKGYLIPADGALPSDARNFRRRALSLRRFEEYVRQARSKHVLTIFDSCFSGTIFDVARAAPPPVITRATTEPVRQFLTSGDAGQEVSDDGTFADLFVDAIEGRRDAAGADGYLTGTELGHFLTERMSNYTNNRQTPKYGKLSDPRWDRGDFVFKLAALTQGNQHAGGGRVDRETEFWKSVEGLGTVEAYRAYLQKHPDGEYTAIAKLKVASLAPTVPRRPAFTVTGLERTMVVTGASTLNVRERPGGTKIATLASGAVVEVTGETQHEGAGWYRVAMAGDKLGFVFGKYLGDRPAATPRVEKAVGVYPKPATPASTPGSVFKDCSDCPEMVVVPPGSFMMGATDAEGEWFLKKGGKQEWLDWERPRHRVTIGKAFSVGKHEVTVGQYRAFAQATGRSDGDGCYVFGEFDGKRQWKKQAERNWRSPGFEQSDSHPVVCVNWKDAEAYVKWLAAHTEQPYRFLSESEWEYAARGGTDTVRYWGNDWDNNSACGDANVANTEHGWSGTFDCKDGFKFTSPVGVYRANGFGLHDVLGNVWEWTEDCWTANYADGPKNEIAREKGDCSRRVLRGGSWGLEPRYLRSANRVRNRIGVRGDIFGFRVARTLTR